MAIRCVWPILNLSASTSRRRIRGGFSTLSYPLTSGFATAPTVSSSGIRKFDAKGSWRAPEQRLRLLAASRSARARLVQSVLADGAPESSAELPNGQLEDEKTVPGVDGPNEPGVKSADGLRAVLDSVAAFASSAFDKLVDPFVGNCSVLQGKWERINGAYLLRPPGRAKAVIHFIGGAFLGRAPHISYRTFLELLASRGFCIVASSYDLQLNYLALTGDIVSQWEAVETDLALDYGAIPVIGVGHSAGAVFHCIASSLFDDMTPKAGNVLVSFNNKVLRQAIPLYASAVLPLARQSVVVENSLPEVIREAVESIPGTIEAAIEGSLVTPTRFKRNFMPAIRDARAVVEQLRPLVRELGGVRRPNDTFIGEEETGHALEEFYPPPSDIAAAIRNMYGVNQTLIVKFSDDSLDESDALLSLMRRRAEETTLVEVDGSHITPLAQELSISGLDGGDRTGGMPVILAELLQTVLREGAVAIGMRDLMRLVVLIDEWVEAGIANDTL